MPRGWLLGILDDIDSKRFGTAFDVLADDAEMHFGVNNWKGRDTILKGLREFDGELGTKHHVLEYWDGGLIKFFRGEIDITEPSTGRTTTSVLTHIWYMSADDPDRVAVLCGSVGPLGNL